MPPNELAKKYQPDTKIYQYKYTRLPALLVPEPTNPHDKNAIMILINGKHVGYIPADECADINTLLSKKSIIDITAKIYSGNYKCLKQIAPDMYDCSTICNELDVEISLNTK